LSQKLKIWSVKHICPSLNVIAYKNKFVVMCEKREIFSQITLWSVSKKHTMGIFLQIVKDHILEFELCEKKKSW
jgi:hypothetical protein